MQAEDVGPLMRDALEADHARGRLPRVKIASTDVWFSRAAWIEEGMRAFLMDRRPQPEAAWLTRRRDAMGTLMAAIERDGDDPMEWLN